jgi:hypothetical protein
VRVAEEQNQMGLCQLFSPEDSDFLDTESGWKVTTFKDHKAEEDEFCLL